jgi:hypothetical protein
LATTTKLTVTVPNGATDGAISVKVGDKTATSATAFTVTEENTGPDAIELNKETLLLNTLTSASQYIANFEDFENPEVVWSVDNMDVIELEDSDIDDQWLTVTGLKAGTATVTVTIGQLSKEFQIIVEPSVFIAGYEGNKAVVWINGLKQYQNDETLEYDRTVAESVLVEDGDVYTTGRDMSGEGTASILKVWKNNESIVTLSNSANKAWGHEILKDIEGELIVVGTGHDGTRSRATIWPVNNVASYTYVSDSNYDGMGYGAALGSNGDVYVAGLLEIDNLDACYLYEADGTNTAIGIPEFAPGSFGRDVYVDEEGVDYIAGVQHKDAFISVPMLWINKGATEVELLDDEGMISDYDALALAIHGKDNLVVMGGSVEDQSTIAGAYVWIYDKDNSTTVASNLSEVGVSSQIRSVFVHDNNIYAAGYKNTTATMWKLDMDGQVIEEVELSTNVSGANGIVVK